MNVFLKSGEFATGVNYWQSKTSMEMWRKWDAKAVEDDFKALSKQGCQILRVFPLWPDFQPITRMYFGDGSPTCEFRFGVEELPDTEAGRAGVDEAMMERFETLADLAAKYKMKLIVALLTGQMTYGLFMPPGLAGLAPASDPVAMAWERRFVQYFVKRMKGHKAIAAWQYGNECNCFKVESREEAWRWMAYLHDAIKIVDPTRPIVSGMNACSGLEDSIFSQGNKWTIGVQGEHSDFLTSHSYMQWQPIGSDPCDTIKQLMAPTCETRVAEDIGGKPAFMEEIGLAWRPMMAGWDRLADYVRGNLWNLWAEDCRGLLWWCGFDQEKQFIAPYDWEGPGPEHGIMSSDRKPRSSGVELKKFRTFVDSLPFDVLPPVERKAVCLLGDYRQHQKSVAAGAFILAKQAGFELEFQHSDQPLKKAALYLLPSSTGRGGLTGAGAERLKKAVAEGATLYMSADDNYLPGIAELFQAEVETRIGKPGSYEFEFEGFKLKLSLKSIQKMNSLGAKTLGEDSSGSPVFFEGRYGKGKVFLLSFPLELAMIETPMAFLEKDSSEAWRIYSKIGAELIAGVVARKDEPMMGVTEHKLPDGRIACLVFNNGPERIARGVLDFAKGWRLEKAFPYGSTCRAKEPGAELDMPPCSGAVLLLKKAR